MYLRLPQELKTHVEAEAKKVDRSTSSYLRFLLQQHKERIEQR